jgi:hypothetical protein
VAAAAAAAIVGVSIVLDSGQGESQSLANARVPMVAADSATYAPTPLTPSPTATATATATATPTRTPTPTPVPTPDVESCYENICLRGVTAYESGGMWHVVGEVVNNNEGPSGRAAGITIEALFFDGTDFVLRNGSGSPVISVVAGANDEVHLGARNYAPFHIAMPAHETAWTWYRVRITGASVAGGNLIRNLNAVILEESSAGGYTATGWVSNNSGHDHASVVITLVLKQGVEVIRVASAPVSPPDLPDGETGGFTITIADAPPGNFDVETFINAIRTN